MVLRSTGKVASALYCPVLYCCVCTRVTVVTVGYCSTRIDRNVTARLCSLCVAVSSLIDLSIVVILALHSQCAAR